MIRRGIRPASPATPRSPIEISLVELPCLSGATFEVAKDGAVEKRAFAPRLAASAAPAGEQTPVARPEGAAAPTAPASAESPPATEAASPSAAFAKAASALATAATQRKRAVANNCGVAPAGRRAGAGGIPVENGPRFSTKKQPAWMTVGWSGGGQVPCSLVGRLGGSCWGVPEAKAGVSGLQDVTMAGGAS